MAKSIAKSVNNWIAKQSSKLLLFRGGFWEIPYMSNSPEALVSSMIKMGFTSHKPLKQQIISKLPFIKGSFYYAQIEKGLWLINSQLVYRANINYINAGEEKFAKDWFLLNLTVYGVQQKHSLINGVPQTNCAWVLHKPGTWATNCHFKSAEEQTFTFYFHRDWILHQMKGNGLLVNSPICHFFNSDANFDIWVDTVADCRPFFSGITRNFVTAESRDNDANLELRKLSYSMLNYFFTKYELNNVSIDHFKVADKTRVVIYKVEKLLLERLTGRFPGLDFLTKEVGISETSLKINFKLVFGSSPGLYFQEKQMYLAREIILQESIKIKDLAQKMGYQNASKFSAAFKKHNKILPSEILQQS